MPRLWTRTSAQRRLRAFRVRSRVRPRQTCPVQACRPKRGAGRRVRVGIPARRLPAGGGAPRLGPGRLRPRLLLLRLRLALLRGERLRLLCPGPEPAPRADRFGSPGGASTRPALASPRTGQAASRSTSAECHSPVSSGMPGAQTWPSGDEPATGARRATRRRVRAATGRPGRRGRSRRRPGWAPAPSRRDRAGTRRTRRQRRR